MPSILEKLAEETARQIAPEPQADSGNRGFDITTIITVIVTIVQTILQQCPLNRSAVKAAFKKPGVRQRAALLKECRESCDCCGIGRQAGTIYNAVLVKAGGLPEADADALIDECQDDRNLLI